jgi:Protein of unknown function (DUF3800)
MLLCYGDDSGERGAFVLASVIMRDETWLRTLDAWNDYRRWLRTNFGLRIRKGRGRTTPVELHATDFATGAGDWRGLPVNRAGRMRALRVGLRLIGRHAGVFAVAWEPQRVQPHSQPPAGGIPMECWNVMLERIASHSFYDHSRDRAVLFVDEGYGHMFTQALRRMRRFHYVGSIYGGSVSAPAPMLLDDPSMRDSKQSAFIQMADPCAYAAMRELRPTASVSDLWKELDPGIIKDVNKRMYGQVPGIKLLPA